MGYQYNSMDKQRRYYRYRVGVGVYNPNNADDNPSPNRFDYIG
jgi:hypothetical protein